MNEKVQALPVKSTPSVTLLEHTKLSNVVIGARTCWGSFHKGGQYDTPTDDLTEADVKLLKRLLFKFKHESIFEHAVYTFRVRGIPRAVLQELARHRLISLSVRSSRYTLKELRDEEPFKSFYMDARRAEKYIYFTGPLSVDEISFWALKNLHELIEAGISNDMAKFALPESYKTDLVMTCNLRELRHILQLRLDKSALWAFRQLAWRLWLALPDTHAFLYSDIIENLEEGC